MAVVKKMVSMDEGVARELEKLSKILGTTQREVIERALDFYFDHTDAMIAEKISREIHEGKMAVHDADDVFRSLGLE
jgi:predicted DNA-binding protein